MEKLQKQKAGVTCHEDSDDLCSRWHHGCARPFLLAQTKFLLRVRTTTAPFLIEQATSSNHPTTNNYEIL